MSKFLYEVDYKKFEELAKDKLADNADVSAFLQKLVDDNDDRRFNFVILNLGELMKICAIELNLKSEEIDGYLKLEKEKIRDRRMNTIIKELNQKLNMRFNLDEKTELVTCLYTYQGTGYIYIDKINFCKLLYDVDIDIETLENV